MPTNPGTFRKSSAVSGCAGPAAWWLPQRHHVVLFDAKSGTLTNLTAKIEEPPTNRLNDGKVGPDGAFWVGSMDENSPAAEDRRALYRVTADGRISKQQGAMRCRMAWRGRRMGASCTTPIPPRASSRPGISTRPTGARANRRTLATLSNDDGRPDGAATDADGNYWSAGPSAGCINCFSPAGELRRQMEVPGAWSDDAVFRRGALYVTSLREGKSSQVLTDYPTLGRVCFALWRPAVGAPVGLFADQ